MQRYSANHSNEKLREKFLEKRKLLRLGEVEWVGARKPDCGWRE
jgi:hypothetical protein